MSAFQDLSGQKFGRLTVIKRVEDQVSASGKHKTQYLCECSCPNHTRIVVTQTHLKDGHTQSCGCLNSELASQRLAERDREKAKHGKYETRLYSIYDGIIDRCVRTNHPLYKARGITICDEWYDHNNTGTYRNVECFRNFYNWSMMNGYDETKSIDRIDNDGPYAPWNCRWVDMRIQNYNKSTNHYVNFNNETFSIGELAAILGIDYNQYYKIMANSMFNPYNAMRPHMTPYGFPVYTYYDNYGNQIPINCIYFRDQYGSTYPETSYEYQPKPCLWECDDKGFIIKPMI